MSLFNSKATEEESLNDIKKSFENDFSEKETKEETDGISLKLTSGTNVVDKETTRRVQNNTLKQIKEYLSLTFGPMGSNTKIIKGNTKETVQSSYSKDGLKVLKNIWSMFCAARFRIRNFVR